MRSYSVTVQDEAIQLIAADNKNRTALINIVGNQAVAIGSSSVTYAEGLLIEKHTTPTVIQVPLGESLWAICDDNETDDVRVLLPDAD